MKKIMAIVLAGLLALSLLPAAAFAQTNVDLAREDGRLLITLDGADIDGRNGGIVAVSGDALKLTLPEGSVNRVTGDGTLTINGNAKNGIKAGDDASLILDGVTVNISAVNDGINGNYDVTLLSGSFTIAAGDDAIHADHILTIGKPDGSGPTIRVTESEEGLEGTVVNVYGGDISIVSRDDAVNAANGDGLYEGVLDYSFNMLGGRLVIQSGGDGIDSNGNVNLVGGSAEIQSSYTGGEAGMDYDGQLYISDAFALNNRSGMAGPDGMGGPGGMGQMNTQPGGMGGQGFGGMNGEPGNMSGRPGGMPGGMGQMNTQPGGMNSQGFGGMNTQQGNMGRPGMDRQG